MQPHHDDRAVDAIERLEICDMNSAPDQDLFFFFQAEDGIRDVAVTGVQTCALPISKSQCLLRRRPLLAGSFPPPPARPSCETVRAPASRKRAARDEPSCLRRPGR